MTVADNLRDIAQEAEPLLENALDVAEQLTGLRDVAKDKGLNWSQLKALLVAKIRDNRDGGNRLEELAEKHDLALTYADMLANRNVAERRKDTPQSSSGGRTDEALAREATAGRGSEIAPNHESPSQAGMGSERSSPTRSKSNEGRCDATGPKHAAPPETTGTVSDNSDALAIETPTGPSQHDSAAAAEMAPSVSAATIRDSDEFGDIRGTMFDRSLWV